MVLLITKYNLSPKWLQLLMFFIFYIILIKLHYFNLNINNMSECMMKNTTNFLSSENTLEILNKELFPERLQNHAILLSGEELSARINDNIRQINEKINNVHEIQQQIDLKKQQMDIKPDEFVYSHQKKFSRRKVADISGIIYTKSAKDVALGRECRELNHIIQRTTTDLQRHLDDLHSIKSEHTARTTLDIISKLGESHQSSSSFTTTEDVNILTSVNLDEFQEIKTQVNEQYNINQQIVDYMNKGLEQDRIELRGYMNITNSKIDSIQENVSINDQNIKINSHEIAQLKDNVKRLEDKIEYQNNSISFLQNLVINLTGNTRK